MKKSFRKPYRIKRRKSIVRNRFFWLGILIFVFAISIFYFLFFSEIFQVKKIIVTGEKKVSTDYYPPATSSHPELRSGWAPDIKLLVEKKLENKILFFKTKSIFSVNLDEIREDILNNFPQIAEVEIGRGFPDALNIIVIERLGIGIFCQNKHCFVLDGEGVIFEEVSEVDPKELKIKNLTLATDVKLGEKVIEKEKLTQILEIESELKKDYNPPATHIPPPTYPYFEIKEFTLVSEERLNAKTSEGWEIYFDLTGDLNWQLIKLSLVLKERIPPEKRRNVEYIDLRFEKVYIFPETYGQ